MCGIQSPRSSGYAAQIVIGRLTRRKKRGNVNVWNMCWNMRPHRRDIWAPSWPCKIRRTHREFSTTEKNQKEKEVKKMDRIELEFDDGLDTSAPEEASDIETADSADLDFGGLDIWERSENAAHENMEGTEMSQKAEEIIKNHIKELSNGLWDVRARYGVEALGETLRRIKKQKRRHPWEPWGFARFHRSPAWAKNANGSMMRKRSARSFILPGWWGTKRRRIEMRIKFKSRWEEIYYALFLINLSGFATIGICSLLGVPKLNSLELLAFFGVFNGLYLILLQRPKSWELKYQRPRTPRTWRTS